VAHEEMKGELYSLATIASVAPLVGLFGTVVGIANSFGGCYGQRSTCIGPVAGALSESMLPTALGLAAALVALWSYEYLAGRLRTIDLEMENASLELLSQLSRFRGRFAADPALVPPGEGLMFGARPLAELSREDKSMRHSMILTGTMLALAWCALAARYLEHDARALYSATGWACVNVLIMFGVSCFPAYAVWVRVMRRRAGGLKVVASTLCLCWSVAELVLGAPLP
jgi:hypothetical protein